MKRHELADILRDRIRGGEYATGMRIPSQRQLLQEFEVSPVTLQRAVDRLSEQGYLIARGSAGTFVTEHLPDRACCALVLTEDPEHAPINQFFATLLRESRAWSDAAGWRFEPWFDHGTGPAHERLCERVADGAIAGLLFASLPYRFDHSPLLTAPVPRVAIGRLPPDCDVANFAASLIHLRSAGVIEGICADFAKAGRRRFAAITGPGSAGEAQAGLAAARKAGLDARIEWWLELPNAPNAVSCARVVAHLLCSGRPEDRPDCLLISDDNLVPAVTAGILDAGLAPADIQVVAHANFPDPIPSAVPCRRYGYDGRSILATALAEIGRLRDGQPRRSVEVPVTVVDADVG
ncbi:MAG: GntR family transcriptional regulator [Planctomycetes bacterium]|nr:GntR family transcriptional regulator [Planctomycetota bacterium]